jgi:hypothetical protein
MFHEANDLVVGCLCLCSAMARPIPGPQQRGRRFDGKLLDAILRDLGVIWRFPSFVGVSSYKPTLGRSAWRHVRYKGLE